MDASMPCLSGWLSPPEVRPALCAAGSVPVPARPPGGGFLEGRPGPLVPVDTSDPALETFRLLEPPSGSLRVVVVDDHERMRWAVRQLLEAVGCTVVGDAVDGPSGVTMTLERCPDVLVTDWRLPGLDGLAVAAQVRAVLPGIRIVLFTAEPVHDGQLLAAGSAVDATVSKGSMPRELVQAVTGSAD